MRKVLTIIDKKYETNHRTIIGLCTIISVQIKQREQKKSLTWA